MDAVHDKPSPNVFQLTLYSRLIYHWQDLSSAMQMYQSSLLVVWFLINSTANSDVVTTTSRHKLGSLVGHTGKGDVSVEGSS